jgi:hypothetical protein
MISPILSFTTLPQSDLFPARQWFVITEYKSHWQHLIIGLGGHI